MFKQTLFIPFLLSLTMTLVGCGGSDGDNVSINVDGNVDPPPPPPPPPGGGDCDTVVQAAFVSFNADCSVGTLTGTISEDYTLLSQVQWQLGGIVTVGNGNQNVADDAGVQAIKDNGVTLTIEPGTSVLALNEGTLLITRGSKLMAEGTAAEPITFSSLDEAFDGFGEWGGVIIQGFAPQYGKGGTGACFGSGTVCNVVGEGGDFVGNYGGNDPADNSGTLRYVRIAEGGLVAGPNNEINGLTLLGVGHGTIIDYIQVHSNLDDGIEWFGGTVNVTHAVLTNNDDDDIDYDEGYMGNIQYALIQKSQTADTPQGSNDQHGIEANSSDASYVPETDAVLANVTIIGGKANNNAAAQAGPQPGMRLRGAVKTAVYNSSVSNFNIGCVRIDDASVSGTVFESNIDMVNVLGDCQDGFYEKRTANVSENVTETALNYSDTFAILESAAQLAQAPVINAVNNGSGFVFEQTDYVGAVDPDPTGDVWWEGWTLPASLGEAVAPPVQPAAFVECNVDNTVCIIKGTINQDYTMVAGPEWRLDGAVVVGTGNEALADDAAVQAIRAAGVTLTIARGVQVRAYDNGSLLITRGSKLNAVGTSANPITFSSFVDDNLDGEGEWGGVIIQGLAPQYGKGGTGPCFGVGTVCNVVGEGGDFVKFYGGNDPADNSGTLRYVRIAEAGKIAGPNNEINGLTLMGVGYGTTIDYLQVHNNLDDGIELFGGTVNVTHVVLTNNDDDDIDFDEGYKGNIQYAIVRKHPTKPAPTGTNDPRGIEANSDNASYVPETNAVLANVLIIGGPAANAASGQPGMRLRGAVNVTVYNTGVRDFNTAGCIRIDDAAVSGSTFLSNVKLVNVLGDCNPGGFYDTARVADPTSTNAVATSLPINAAYAITTGTVNVTAPTIVAVDNGSGFTFDNTDYVGAVEPGSTPANAWWSGWTIEGSL